MGIPMPTPSALPHQATQHATAGPRISFVEERVHLGRVGESKPIASMHTPRTGGQTANRVPLGPPQTTRRPLVGLTNTKSMGSIGGGSKNKTRPSHFQKWVTKFSGSGDPYDHLATFNQVVRAEEVNSCPQGRFWIDLIGKGSIMVPNTGHKYLRGLRVFRSGIHRSFHED